MSYRVHGNIVERTQEPRFRVFVRKNKNEEAEPADIVRCINRIRCGFLDNTLELMKKCAPFDHCPNHVNLSANVEPLDPHHQTFLRFNSSARGILL